MWDHNFNGTGPEQYIALTRGNKIRGKQNTHYNCDGDELIAAVSLGGADVALLDVLQHCAAEH